MIDTLVFILAGGRGQRLVPLTHRRAKPAMRFGGPEFIREALASMDDCPIFLGCWSEAIIQPRRQDHHSTPERVS
jgi:Nucleotidyl transferase